MNSRKGLLALSLALLFTVAAQADQRVVVDGTTVIYEEQKTLDELKQEYEALKAIKAVQKLDVQAEQELDQKIAKVLAKITKLQQHDLKWGERRIKSLEKERKRDRKYHNRDLKKAAVEGLVVGSFVTLLAVVAEYLIWKSFTKPWIVNVAERAAKAAVKS